MRVPDGIEMLLFDLGGVIIDIEWNRAFTVWAEYSPFSAEEIARVCHPDEAYEQHERGELTGSEYFAHLRNMIAFSGPDEALVRGWNAILAREIPETVALLRRLEGQLPMFLFSNSNPTHEACWRSKFADALTPFKGLFVSSSMGCRKPEREAFDAVVAATGFRSSAILFFDDTEENVAGARAAGLNAVQVSSHADIARALGELRA